MDVAQNIFNWKEPNFLMYLHESDAGVLGVFETKIQRKIFVNYNFCIRTNKQRYALLNIIDVVQSVNIQRLR